MKLSGIEWTKEQSKRKKKNVQTEIKPVQPTKTVAVLRGR